MSRRVTFEPKSIQDLIVWQQDEPKTVGRILRIIEETRRDPFNGIGKPEPLKGNLKGKWSRRITDEHRMIYIPLATKNLLSILYEAITFTKTKRLVLGYTVRTTALAVKPFFVCALCCSCFF